MRCGGCLASTVNGIRDDNEVELSSFSQNLVLGDRIDASDQKLLLLLNSATCFQLDCVPHPLSMSLSHPRILLVSGWVFHVRNLLKERERAS